MVGPLSADLFFVLVSFSCDNFARGREQPTWLRGYPIPTTLRKGQECHMTLPGLPVVSITIEYSRLILGGRLILQCFTCSCKVSPLVYKQWQPRLRTYLTWEMFLLLSAKTKNWRWLVGTNIGKHSTVLSGQDIFKQSVCPTLRGELL